MVIQKASINGINRRRNRVGAHILAGESDFVNPNKWDDNNELVFQVKSLETLLEEGNYQGTLSVDKIGDACLFASNSRVGKALIRRHENMIGNYGNNIKRTDVDDPILIHFHDIPIIIVRALPIIVLDEDNLDENSIYVSDVHCHNNKICEDSRYKVTCCSRQKNQSSQERSSHDQDNDYPLLSAVGVEVFPRYSGKDVTVKQSNSFMNNTSKVYSAITLEAKDIAKQLLNNVCASVLSVNELKVVAVNNVELVCRVAKVRVQQSNLEEKDDVLENSHYSASEAAMDEPFRGRVHIVNTEFYISPNHSSTITIIGDRKIPDGELPDDVVHITTSDKEWFPVRRILLAPCIKMTKYVQAGRGKYKEIPSLSDSERSPDAPAHNDGRPQCKVDIDCCTFDRVLLFIMSLLYPQEYRFKLEMSEINTLAQAAEILGLQPLADLCGDQLSSFDSRVRKDKYIRLEEIKRRNSRSDELLIILDGMVLDITRWIDEHPGGPSIIPSQALNIDCTCFFEMYHVSRQSFLYLKSFYVGELSPEDAATLASSAEGITASDGFLQSLRSYTSEWRVSITENVGENIHNSL